MREILGAGNPIVYPVSAALPNCMDGIGSPLRRVSGHRESLNVDDDTPDDEYGTWELAPLGAVLAYVEYLPEAVANRVRGKTRCYQLDPHRETGRSFWMNHCAHCGAQVEEEELHEIGGPFGSMASEGQESIKLHPVSEPFVGWAGRQSRRCHPKNRSALMPPNMPGRAR